MLADVISYCIMKSIMVLDGVTSFLRLKSVTNTSKGMRHCPTIGGVLQCNGEKLEGVQDLKCVFIVNCVLESK